jgi:penicillin-binding protein 1A
VLALVAVTTTVVAGCQYTSDLRLPERQAESTKILAADGSVLTTVHGEQNRERVDLAGMAPVLQDAVVAIEDARYFDHDGVDPRGLLRALSRDISSGRADEGGSTITQQYVRAVMLGSEKTLVRKLREAVLALQLEHKYSKREILQRYLNTVYFGNGAYGVEAASRLYFARPARDVDLAQAALLAGLIQAPERTNPYRDPAAAQQRRDVVLDRMAELGRAAPEEVAAARAQPLGVVPQTPGGRYPAAHFVAQVERFVTSNPAFGPDRPARERRLFTGGLRIETTLDPALQHLAERAVAEVLVDPAADPEAALVSIDPRTGHVVAYVGGRDFFGDSPSAQFDLAQNATGRSSGSAFKPFVLAAALEAGIPLSRTFPAPSELTIPVEGQEPWTVANYEGRGDGSRMDLSEATVESVNTVYAQLMMEVGPQAAVDAAARLGVRTPLLANPAAVLGTNGVTALDLASAYASFAGDGLHAEPVFVTRVTDRDGTVLYQAPKARRRVLDAVTSRTVTDVLQEVVTDGTGVNARIGRQTAGKTGTAEDYSDAWFVGYTPELSTAVWVGFPGALQPMTPPTTRITVTGGTWPAEIWQRYQGAALADRPASAFPSRADAERDARDRRDTGTTTTTRAGVRLPSVVGMREADARRVLAEVGVGVETETAPSADFPPGVVLAQSPPAGSPGGSDTVVTLTLAVEPPPQTAVPSVLGLRPEDARAIVEGRGLAIEVVTEPEPPPGDGLRAGLAWKQSPVGGSPAAVGSTVRVWTNPDG